MDSPPPPSGLPPMPPIQTITGAFIFGLLFNWALFGVLCVQVYIYARSFPTDKRWMKGLVYSVFVLEIVQTALTGADAYFWFGVGYGDPSRLANTNLSSIDVPLLAAVVSLIVQTFFCYRIYTLGQSLWPLCLFIILVSLMQAGCAMYGAIMAEIVKQISEAQKQRGTVIAWLVGSAVSDTLIAVAMTILLLNEREKEQFYASDILARVVKLTMETNSMTASVAIITVIIFLTKPGTNWFYGPTAVMGKLYSNTLLVTFNNRIALREVALRRGAGSSNRSASFPSVPFSTTQAEPFGGSVKMTTLGGSDTTSAFGHSKSFERVSGGYGPQP